MLHAQPKISPGKWDTQTSLGFRDTNGSPNLGQTTGPCNNPQRRACRIVDFAVLAYHRVKLKKSKKKNKYIDLAMKMEKTLEHESEGYTNCN